MVSLMKKKNIIIVSLTILLIVSLFFNAKYIGESKTRREQFSLYVEDYFDELLYKYIFDIEKESELLKAYKENK